MAKCPDLAGQPDGNGADAVVETGRPVRTTLCYLERDGQYLMMLRNKKAHDANEGKYLGVGGKFLPGETPRECALREINEETGLSGGVLEGLEYRGIVHFVSDTFPDEDMYLFTCRLPEGFDPPLVECSEGALCWVDIDAVESLPLWEGDRLFLRELAAGARDIHMRLIYQGDSLVACEA